MKTGLACVKTIVLLCVAGTGCTQTQVPATITATSPSTLSAIASEAVPATSAPQQTPMIDAATATPAYSAVTQVMHFLGDDVLRTGLFADRTPYFSDDGQYLRFLGGSGKWSEFDIADRELRSISSPWLEEGAEALLPEDLSAGLSESDISTLVATRYVNGLSISPNGDYLAYLRPDSDGDGNELVVENLRESSTEFTYSWSNYEESRGCDTSLWPYTVWTNDQRRFVLICDEGDFFVVDREQQAVRGVESRLSEYSDGYSISPDDSSFAYTSASGWLSVLDLETLSLRKVVAGGRCARWSGDNNSVYYFRIPGVAESTMYQAVPETGVGIYQMNLDSRIETLVVSSPIEVPDAIKLVILDDCFLAVSQSANQFSFLGRGEKTGYWILTRDQ